MKTLASAVAVLLVFAFGIAAAQRIARPERASFAVVPVTTAPPTTPKTNLQAWAEIYVLRHVPSDLRSPIFKRGTNVARRNVWAHCVAQASTWRCTVSNHARSIHHVVLRPLHRSGGGHSAAAQ